MKITLLDVKGDDNQCLYKDWAGGFGTNFSVGESVFAKAIEFMKRTGVNLPITSYGYIAAICKGLGHEVGYATNSVPVDSDVVVIQSSIVDYKAELRFADRIRNTTNSKVCFIGPFAAQMPKIYRKHADFIVKGEPENSIIKICKGDVRPGLVESEPVKDLDKLPFPNWDAFPVKSYSYSPTLGRKPVLPVLSSRGCFYGCNYCPYKVQWSYRVRSPENVVEEIKYLVDRYGVRSVIFRDPLFTCNPKRAESIAKGLIKSDVDIEWGCETRLDHLSTPLLRVLHESGLRSMEVGIESFYDEIVNAENRKPIAKRHQEEIVKFCDKIGIRVAAFYIIGMPNDTLDTVKKTIEYAKSLNTDVASFAISTPFSGTEFYERVKNKIYEKDWEKFTTYTPVYEHPNLSREQLLKLKELAFITYFYRPKYLLKFFERMFK
jgi:radical SAM superfamily enzyme YgiQ (UPF0313 family)